MNAHPLIGPAAAVLAAARELAARRNPLAVLLEGYPGVGKSDLSDRLALELTGSRFAVEQLNGQSVSVDIVRQWRERAAYGNLFSKWTVKRIDEIDQMSNAAVAELLTYLDYLPANVAVIATTNEYAKLRATCKGRLETRFVHFQVAAPSIDETAAFLVRTYRVTKTQARAIALGAVPDGCLPTEGCNVRAAINDAVGLRAALNSQPSTLNRP